MDSKQFEDEKNVRWTVTIRLNSGPPSYGPNKLDRTKPHLLVFTPDKGVIKKYVATKKSSISDYSIEELKTLLKKSQQSKP